MRNEYAILVRKLEGKGPLGRLSSRWEDNIRMDLREVGREFVECINLVQSFGRWPMAVNTVMKFRVP
jgi:hypothetical protein